VALTGRSWITGTVAVGAAVLAGSWLLVIDPVRSETATVRASIEQQAAQNTARELALIRLAEQYEHLDAQRAELAGLQAAIPAEAELPGLTRQLQEAAARSGVTIVQLTSATPAAVNGATAADAPPAGDGGAEAAGGAGSVPVLSRMQLGFTVLGDYDAVQRFVSEVQTGTERLLLVSAVTATSQAATDASGGRPATAAGDVEASFTAYAFTLADPAATAIPAEEQPGSLPTSDRDPFAPLN
jgi:hypothetical protein